MSWEIYVKSLTDTGFVDKAAIFGAQDASLWSQSPGTNISGFEVKALLSGLTNPSQLRTNGAFVGGIKYGYLMSTDTDLRLKQGATGVVVAKAIKSLIIGLYRDGQDPGKCAKAVTKLRDDLVSKGY